MSLYLLNVGPKTVKQECFGMVYDCPPGKVREIADMSDPRSPVTPLAVVEMILRYRPAGGLVRYDFTERAEEGVEAYHYRKQVEGYEKMIAAIDEMIGGHNLANDDRERSKQSRLGPTRDLKAKMDERKIVAAALEKLGHAVIAMPEIELPAIDVPDLQIPPQKIRPVAGPGGIIDPMTPQPTDLVPAMAGGEGPKGKGKAA